MVAREEKEIRSLIASCVRLVLPSGEYHWYGWRS